MDQCSRDPQLTPDLINVYASRIIRAFDPIFLILRRWSATPKLHLNVGLCASGTYRIPLARRRYLEDGVLFLCTISCLLRGFECVETHTVFCRSCWKTGKPGLELGFLRIASLAGERHHDVQRRLGDFKTIPKTMSLPNHLRGSVGNWKPK